MPKIVVLDESHQTKHPIIAVGGLVADMTDVPAIERKWRATKASLGFEPGAAVKYSKSWKHHGDRTGQARRSELIHLVGELPLQALAVLLEDFRPASYQHLPGKRSDLYVQGPAFEYVLQRLAEPEFCAPNNGPHIMMFDHRDDFARRFLKAHALWELLWPDNALLEQRQRYRWLASVYESVQPSQSPDALLWHRLGAKTLALINEHIVSVTVRGGATEHVTIDEETLQALRQLGFEGIEEESAESKAPPTPEEIIESIEERVQRKLEAHPNSPTYQSLAARLEQLRQMQLVEAADSIEFLKKLLEVAREVVAAEAGRADEGDTSTLAALAEPETLLPEERIGALTQLFNEVRPETTPEIVEKVVHEIDAVASGVKPPPGSDQATPVNWQTSREGVRLVKQAIRVALTKYGLPPTGDLFERAYNYVAEHY